MRYRILFSLAIVTILSIGTNSSSIASAADCEMPAFANALPFRYRNQIKRVWLGFPEGSKECQLQLQQTLRIIDSLPDSLKLRIADYKTNLMIGGRMHFLIGLLPDEVADFSRIMRNRSISEAQRIAMLREWASDKLSVDASDYFEKFLKSFAERTARFEARLKNLSKEAKVAYDRLQVIQREKQLILEDLSLSVKRELAALWNLMCPKSRRRQAAFGSEEDGRDWDADEQMLACSKGLEDTVRLLKPRPTFVTRPSVHPNEASVSFTPAATVVRKNATSKGEWVHFWRKMSSLRKHEA